VQSPTAPFGKDVIESILPHRDPFLLIDNVLELAPGERVVGQGEEIGTVYELNDGRTVIVRPEDSSPVPGEGAPVAPEGEEIAPEGTAPEDPVAPDGGSVPEIELEPPE
jgi:hypothetical protein